MTSHDAGSSVDGGPSLDAGALPDASTSPDASVSAGAGPSFDAGIFDAGAQPDASVAIDSGVAVDSGVTEAWRRDAGLITLALGQNHGCALLDHGTVLCWGAGMIGSDGGTGAHVRQRNARSLASSFSASFAITTDEQLTAWGTNYYAEFGNGTTAPSSTPVNTALAGTPKAVSGGAYHACALVAGGGAECWGLNGTGQTGGSPQMMTAVPVVVSNVANAISLSCGGSSSFALLGDGGVLAWGYDLIAASHQAAATFPISAAASQISSGWFHACAVLKTGELQCWGRAFEGELGFDAGSVFLLNGIVPNLHDVVNACAGFKYSCAVQRDGGSLCWGDNTYGQLGTGNFEPQPTPRRVELPAATAVLCAEKVTCARTASQGTYCWGDNGNGQFGAATPVSSTTPIRISIP